MYVWQEERRRFGYAPRETIQKWINLMSLMIDQPVQGQGGQNVTMDSAYMGNMIAQVGRNRLGAPEKEEDALVLVLQPTTASPTIAVATARATLN